MGKEVDIPFALACSDDVKPMGMMGPEAFYVVVAIILYCNYYYYCHYNYFIVYISLARLAL